VNLTPTLDLLAPALASAQGELENAAKASQNPHFRSKYADLAEIINTVRPVLSKHGLSFVQSPSYVDGIVTVETVLLHTSGQWVAGSLAVPVTKQDAQGVGSAITYARRYSLAAIVGIAQEDDDGNAAVGPRKATRTVTAPPTGEAAVANVRLLLDNAGTSAEYDAAIAAARELTPDQRSGLQGSVKAAKARTGNA